MKVVAPFEIGGRLYHVEADGETMADIVRQIAPWQAFERATVDKPDAIFSHRSVTKNGDTYEYFALLSPSENKEFPLGLSNKVKGQLFPGRVVKDGGQKKTVRGWQGVQYGANIEEEEAGETGNSGKLLQMPPAQPGETTKPATGQNSQPAQGKTQSSNGAPEPSMEEKRALAFVAMQMVTVTNRVNNKPNQWEVGNDGPGTGPHSVWRDQQDRPQCSCPELIERRKAEPGYRCAHILAVKIYHEQLNQQANKKAS